MCDLKLDRVEETDPLHTDHVLETAQKRVALLLDLLVQPAPRSARSESAGQAGARSSAAVLPAPAPEVGHNVDVLNTICRSDLRTKKVMMQA